MSDRDRSPRRGMCAAVLVLEAITVALATPVMITVNDVGVTLALVVGLGVALLCVLVSGRLRDPRAYTVGWVVQVLAVAMGFLVPLMFVVGALFALLWGMADGLGRKIEQERAAAYAEFDRLVDEGPPPA